MELVIEAMDESGPMGFPAISVAHYGEQNGDAMRDPEMCFELGIAGGAHLSAFYYRNDYVGVEQWSREYRARQLCPPDCFARAARAFRKDVGQQPAIAGIRRSFHGQVHSRLVRSLGAEPCPTCAAP